MHMHDFNSLGYHLATEERSTRELGVVLNRGRYYYMTATTTATEFRILYTPNAMYLLYFYPLHVVYPKIKK